MTPRQAAERMKEIEEFINMAREDTIDEKNKIIIIENEKQEAKEIYQKFEDGCGYWYKIVDVTKVFCGDTEDKNGNIWFCPYCQEIKEIWEKLKNV